ncbi:hypothetical protein ABZY45_13560 [Streptomyces sp. NPDC006516]|uniref:hypothetical protein n=1 Tax=Streptomyces sp. NPDC006516 TaxID=3154309 RepID=UPI0033A69BDE
MTPALQANASPSLSKVERRQCDSCDDGIGDQSQQQALYEAGRYTEAEGEVRAVARSRPDDHEYEAAALLFF